MRWNKKPSPKEQSTRYYKRFALLPITIGTETRWLEMVTTYQSSYISGIGEKQWCDLFFFDDATTNESEVTP